MDRRTPGDKAIARANPARNVTWGVIIDVLDALTEHGYRRKRNLDTEKCAVIIGQLIQEFTGKNGGDPE